MRKVSNKTN